MNAHFYVTGPDATPTGEMATYMVGVDVGGDHVGAVALTAVLSGDFFTDVTVQPLAFAANDDVRVLHTDGDRINFSGVTLNPATGQVDLLTVTARVNGPNGRGVPLTIESRGGVTQDGIPLFLHSDVSGSDTHYVFTEHASVEIVDRPLQPAYAGEAYQAVLTAKDGRGSRQWSHTDGALPAGIQLSQNGVLSGQPELEGSYSFELTVIDSGTPSTSAAAWFTLVVRAQLLYIETSRLPTATPGAAYSVALEHTGGRAPVSWQADGLPTGLSPDGDTITGALASDFDDFGFFDITLTVQDAADPPQGMTRSFKLLVSPIAATAVIDAPGARHVAVGRDLYMTHYAFSVDARVIQPERGFIDRRAIQDAKGAILQELFLGGALTGGGVGPVGPPLNEDQVFWVGMDEFYGSPHPLGEDDLVGYQPDPGNPNPPGGGPLGPEQSEVNRLWQLLQLYNELDEMQNGSAHFNVTLEVLIDDILALTYRTGLDDSSTEPGPAAGLYGVYPPVQMTAKAVFFLTGGWLLGSVRRSLDRRIQRRRESVAREDGGTSKAHATGGAKMRDHEAIAGESSAARLQASSDRRTPADSSRRATLGTMLATRLERRVQTNRWLFRLVPAAAVLATVLAFVAGGLLGGGLFLGIAGAGVLYFGGQASNRFNDRLEGMGDIIDDVVDERRKKPKNDGSSGRGSTPVEVFLTPGSHRVSVRWDAQMVTSNRYGAAASIGSFLNYDLRIAATNKEQWSRFDGDPIEIAGSGSVMSDRDDYPVSLTGSNIDVILAYPGAVQPALIPAIGGGDYGPAQPFPDPWAAYRLDDPPQLDQLQVVQIDEYGRNSLAATSGSLIYLWANRVGAFRGRGVTVETDAPNSNRLVAADLTGDGWRRVLAVYGPDVFEVGAIKPDPIDNQQVTTLTVTAHSTGTDVVSFAGVADLVATTYARLPVLASPIGGEPASPVEDLVGAFGFEAILRLYQTNQGLAFADVQDLVTFDRNPITTQPSSVTFYQSGFEIYLLLALWQSKEILRWRRTVTGGWESLPPKLLTFRPRRLIALPEVLPGPLVSGDHRLMWWRDPTTEDGALVPVAASGGHLAISESPHALGLLDPDGEQVLIFG